MGGVRTISVMHLVWVLSEGRDQVGVEGGTEQEGVHDNERVAYRIRSRFFFAVVTVVVITFRRVTLFFTPGRCWPSYSWLLRQGTSSVMSACKICVCACDVHVHVYVSWVVSSILTN